MLFSVIAIALLTLGCVSIKPIYDVEVSGFSRSDLPGEAVRYALEPADKSISRNDLQFEEYCRYVDSVLTKNGYVKVESIDDATIVVFFSYGIGNPQEHQYSYSLPMSGQTGISSSSTEGTTDSHGNWDTDEGTAVYPPPHRLRGYQQVHEKDGTYHRYFLLSAIDFQKYKEDQQINELWRIEASSTGYSSDLRVVIPVMVAASAQYMGKNTGKAISISLKDDDPAVMEMRSQNLQGN